MFKQCFGFYFSQVRKNLNKWYPKIIVKREKNEQIHNKTKNKLLYKKEMNSVKWIKHLKDDLAWLLHTRKYKRKEREKNTFWLLNVNLQINNKKKIKRKLTKEMKLFFNKCVKYECMYILPKYIKLYFKAFKGNLAKKNFYFL